MAAAAVDPCLSPPDGDYPKGTVQQNSQGSPWFWVRGSREWHLVNAETGECTCPDFVWRCARRVGDMCKHGKAVARHLHDCPACHGSGAVTPTGILLYVARDGTLDPGPWTCCICEGSGQR